MSNLKPYAIGLDIGGTKIAGGIVDSDTGAVLLRSVIPTQPQRGGEAVLTDALGLAQTLIAQATQQGWRVAGIGVGICELVDPAGNCTSAQTIDWRNLPVHECFAQLAPTMIESDVRAPALAEALYGAGKPYKLFAYLTVGTGISYTLVQEGRPFAGARGNALVLGTMPLTTTCTNCGSVLRPVLEEIASGPALAARYSQQIGRSVARAEDVIGAAQTGDPVAIAVVQSAGEALGNSVGFLVNVLDPKAIIVGGGLGLAGGLYWDSFVASTRVHIYADNSRDLPILPAALGVDAGLIGAAARVFQEIAPD